MTDKEQFHAAVQAIKEAQAFTGLNRCINCEHYQGACTKHGDIPADYLYTPNECPDHAPNIPF